MGVFAKLLVLAVGGVTEWKIAIVSEEQLFHIPNDRFVSFSPTSSLSKDVLPENAYLAEMVVRFGRYADLSWWRLARE